MKTRKTKQKEIIYEILKENRIHPTIQEIYLLAKAKYPNIGQATVYRNINKLVEEGSILKLPSTDDESYRYDINIAPHSHLVCNCCGKIVDIFNTNYDKMINYIEEENCIKVTKSLLVLEGICSKCKNKKIPKQ